MRTATWRSWRALSVFQLSRSVSRWFCTTLTFDDKSCLVVLMSDLNSYDVIQPFLRYLSMNSLYCFWARFVSSPASQIIHVFAYHVYSSNSKHAHSWHKIGNSCFNFLFDSFEWRFYWRSFDANCNEIQIGYQLAAGRNHSRGFYHRKTCYLAPLDNCIPQVKSRQTRLRADTLLPPISTHYKWRWTGEKKPKTTTIIVWTVKLLEWNQQSWDEGDWFQNLWAPDQ